MSVHEAEYGQIKDRYQRPHFPGNFEVLIQQEFFDDYARYAQEAKQRIYAQTMYVEPGKSLYTITSAMVKARESGTVDTRLLIDHYSLLVNGKKVWWWPKLEPAERETAEQLKHKKKQTIADLQEAGVSVTLTNPPRNIAEHILPFIGRNHIKVAVVDDVGWIGGMSFNDADLSREDFMMRFTDPDIVEGLADMFLLEYKTPQTRDIELPCTQNTTIIRDAGRNGQSRIMDYTIELIEGAEQSIRLLTQFTLNGRIAKSLSDAYKRRVDTQAIISARSALYASPEKLMYSLNMIDSGIRGFYIPTIESRVNIHGKAIFVDGMLPEKAIGGVGSHNFSPNGVRLGTTEMTVFSRDNRFIGNLSDYWEKIKQRTLISGDKLNSEK